MSVLQARLRPGPLAGLRRPLGASFAASASIQLLNAVTGVILARALGADARGQLAAVVLWPSLLAMLGAMGIPEAATYHAARRTPLGTLAGTVAAVAMGQSAALVAAGFVVLPLVLGRQDDDAVRAAYLFLAFVPLNLLALHMMGIVNGLQRYTAFQALRLGTVGVGCAGIVGLALGGHISIRSVVVVYIVANLLAAFAATLLVVQAGAQRFGFSRALARSLLRCGLRSHTTNVAGQLNERLDQLVISVFLAPVYLGLYVVAVTLTSLSSLIGASVAQVALPASAALEHGAVRGTARRLVALTLIGSVVVTVPLLVFTRQIIELSFGESFGDAADVTRILLVAGIVLSTSRALGAVLTGLGRPLDAALPELMALVVTLAALAALLPWLGLVGAGVASLLAYSIGLAAMVRRARRLLARTEGDG